MHMKPKDRLRHMRRPVDTRPQGHAQRQKRQSASRGFESELEGAELSDSFVVTDGNIITAKGMGSSREIRNRNRRGFCRRSEDEENRGVAPMLLRDIREEEAAIRSKMQASALAVHRRGEEKPRRAYFQPA